MEGIPIGLQPQQSGNPKGIFKGAERPAPLKRGTATV